MTTVAERLATALAPYADEMFGLLGNGNAFVVDAMLRLTPIRYTAVRHEVATVASADAYYRGTRKLAIATATYGAGFTNTITALTEASMARIPMLVLVGDAPTTGLRPWDLDQDAITRAVGVKNVTVRADYVAAAVNDAVRFALIERRPVVLSLPYDLPVVTSDEGDVAPIDFDQVLASERPQADAVALAAQVATGPDQAMALIKDLCRQAPRNTLEEQLELEAQYMVRSQESEESREGIGAFLEKRAADFTKLRG